MRRVRWRDDTPLKWWEDAEPVNRIRWSETRHVDLYLESASKIPSCWADAASVLLLSNNKYPSSPSRCLSSTLPTRRLTSRVYNSIQLHTAATRSHDTLNPRSLRPPRPHNRPNRLLRTTLNPQPVRRDLSPIPIRLRITTRLFPHNLSRAPKLNQ